MTMMCDRYQPPRPKEAQLRIGGWRDPGELDVEAARKWVAQNPDAWAFMADNAERLARRGRVSAKYLMEMARNELRVSIPNVLSPAIARLMVAERPHLAGAFRMASSRSDGYVAGAAS